MTETPTAAVEVETEKPWTKMQIVAATAAVFSVACMASVGFDKALTKLFKL